MGKLPFLLTTNYQTCIHQVAASTDPCKRSCKSNYVDEYLLVEIFKGMPAKSLCRMRCVCKMWNSLISSPFFIRHHHLHHPKSYLLLKRIGKADRIGLYNNNPDRGVPSYAFYYPNQGVPFDHLTMFDSLPFELSPFRTRQQRGPLFFFDVIHGVVCLTSSEYQDPSNSPTILWNPGLHKYVKIPNSPFQFDGGYDHNQYASSLGFGFNSHKFDFMVMRLWMPIQFQTRRACNKPRPLLYEVFSPQDGVSVKAVATCIRPGEVISRASFFMNGTIHWIVSANQLQKKSSRRRTEYCRLLMFDCEREKFTTMKLPKGFNRCRDDTMRPIFFRFRDMLAVVILTSKLYLWVMEEYGMASSWKKLPYYCEEKLPYYCEGRSEFHGLISHESMFLTEVKSQTFSYVKKQDNNDGKVYYEIDGRTCEHILI